MTVRRFFRFRLRALLLAVTVASLWLGTVGRRAVEQHEIVMMVTRVGGRIGYESDQIPRLQSSGPHWSVVFSSGGF
jgi:hypothetical protein